MDKNMFPQELAVLRQWVCWRLEPDKKTGRDAKVPYSPTTGKRASSSNSATWGTLEDALNCAEKYLFSGIDIDNCLVDGQPNETAADILAHIPPTYIEVSPSGVCTFSSKANCPLAATANPVSRCIPPADISP